VFGVREPGSRFLAVLPVPPRHRRPAFFYFVTSGILAIERLLVDDLQITPAETKARLDRDDAILLVDVREPWETQLCQIAGAQLIPMGSIPANLQTLDVDGEVICYCHHGVRSLDVAVWLRSKGVEHARSMTGGIDRWSIEIDPSIPRY